MRNQHKHTILYYHVLCKKQKVDEKTGGTKRSNNISIPLAVLKQQQDMTKRAAVSTLATLALVVVPTALATVLVGKVGDVFS